MLVIGARGHAKEIFQIIPKDEHTALYFYDDVNADQLLVFNKFNVCKNLNQAKLCLSHDSRFILGIGSPSARRKLADKFTLLGGILTSIVADTAIISPFSKLGEGINIMNYCFIAPDVSIGKGSLINAGASIHHDSTIGDYCEISPGARLLGACIIESSVFIGAAAVILPGITVGNGAIVGAGAVVTKNVISGSKVAGVPARKLTTNTI